jgi:hypothetical protein
VEHSISIFSIEIRQKIKGNNMLLAGCLFGLLFCDEDVGNMFF